MWLLVAVLIITYAILVVVGREMLPIIDRYQPQINRYISDRIGLDFRVESLGGYWSRLTPVLESGGVSIVGDSEKPFLTIDELSAEIDLPASLASMELLWRQLSADSVHVTLSEEADGSWSLGGIPLAGGDTGGLDGLINVLFYSNHIEIKHLALTLEFYSGVRNQVFGHNILLENSGDFHRSTASVALEDSTEDLATLVLEGVGDPRKLKTFVGKGYLRLNHINFSGSLSMLVRSWLPDIAERVGDIDTELDAEFWLQTRFGGGVELSGRIAATEIPLNWSVDLPPLRNFHTELTGWYRLGEDWGLRLQGLDADWGEKEIKPLNAFLSQKVGDRWTEFNVGVDHLNLEILRGLLGTAGILNEELTTVLTTLNPRGDLNNLHLSLDVDPENPNFLLRANLHDLAIDSFRGAPAARGISGYVEAHGAEGFVELDSDAGFAMHYPQAFDNYMEHDRARGRIDWRVDPELVSVQSGPIEISNEEGQGKAYLNLALPLDGTGEPEMTLVVGLRESNTRYLHHYLPRVLSPDLLKWLDAAIGAGEIAEAGFIWRGSLAGDSADKRTVQVYSRARRLDFTFQDDWLPLRDVEASLVIDDIRTDVHVDSARMGEAELVTADVRLREASATGNLVLGITGELTADTGAAVAIMRRSPLRDRVGLSEDWVLTGDSRVKVDLQIPLNEKDRGTEQYDVRVELDKTRLTIGATGLVADNIAGSLGFDLQRGLHGKKLRGSLLQGPVAADISTVAEDVRIDLQGRVSMASLASYLGPVAERFQGETAYEGEILIPSATDQRPSVTITSDFKGVSIDLPAPFTKAADRAWPSTTRLQLLKDSIDIEGVLAERHGLHIVHSDRLPLRGTLGINTTQVHLTRNPGLLVRGRFNRFDSSEWQQVIASPEAGAPAGTAGSGADSAVLETLQPRLDLRIGDLIVSDFSVGNTRLKGNREQDSWHFELESGLLGGDVYLADADAQPIKLRLDYLRLPALPNTVDKQASAGSEAIVEDSVADNEVQDGAVSGEDEGATGGLLDGLDPRALPALDFATEELSLGEQNYGHLAFISEKRPDGILLRDLRGDIRGVIFGEHQEAHPTLLQWVTDGINHQTYVSATLRTDNIGTVLETWGAPKLVDSKKAAFSVDVTWQDKPWTPKAGGLLGYVGLNLEKGNFYKSPGGGTSALIKIVGLFNFDTWLRRLRFDFSDFFSTGVSYDQIRGGIAFEDGIMSFEEPLQTEMPSGKIRLLGRADLVNEQLDARLVATMPVGTNLPWVAALVGGLPAAAGVFVTSKLFKKEVDKLSSISYRVTGDWDDPDLKVDRIFSDKTDFEPGERPAPLVDPDGGDDSGGRPAAIPAPDDEAPGEGSSTATEG